MAEAADAIDTFSYAAPDDPRLKRFFIRLVERLTGQPYLKWVYEDNRAHPVPGENFWSAAIRRLELKLDYNSEALVRDQIADANLHHTADPVVHFLEQKG